MEKLARLALLAAAVLVCAASATTVQTPAPAATGGDPTGCTAACGHYFDCKGMADQALLDQCVAECQAQNPDPTQAATYAQLDCATAVELAESQGGIGGGGGGGGEGGAPAGGACNADCTGCVWDGSSCYHQGMANMGTVIACDACCCAQGGPAQRWD